MKSFHPFSRYDGSILTVGLLLARPVPRTSVTLGIRCTEEQYMNTGLGIFGFTNPGTSEGNSVLTR